MPDTALPSLSSPAPRRGSYLGGVRLEGDGRPVPGDRPAVLRHQPPAGSHRPPSRPLGSCLGEVAAKLTGLAGLWGPGWVSGGTGCPVGSSLCLSVPLPGSQASPPGLCSSLLTGRALTRRFLGSRAACSGGAWARDPGVMVTGQELAAMVNTIPHPHWQGLGQRGHRSRRRPRHSLP